MIGQGQNPPKRFNPCEGCIKPGWHNVTLENYGTTDKRGNFDTLSYSSPVEAERKQIRIVLEIEAAGSTPARFATKYRAT